MLWSVTMTGLLEYYYTLHYEYLLASITKSSFMMVRGTVSMEALVEGFLFLHVLLLLV